MEGTSLDKGKELDALRIAEPTLSAPAGLVVGGIVIASHGDGFAVTVAAIGIFITGSVLLCLPDFRMFGKTMPAGSSLT